jgi:hypothetical protein
MNIGFAVAALFSFLAFLAHTFGNIKTTVRPLLESDLADASKYLTYYCWHIVTLTLAAVVAAFAYAAVVRDGKDVGAFATAISVGCLLWSVLMNQLKKLRIRDFPQWVFFIPICAPAIWGLF